MISHTIPDGRWLKVGADIAELGTDIYLVVVDYLSKFPEVVSIAQKTASAVIKALKSIFACTGIPTTLIADNNPFGAAEMQAFANEWHLEIITSSPHYPQSNGQIERTIHTVKSMLKKCRDDHSDPYLGLLQLRNSPIDDVLPALLKRQIQQKQQYDKTAISKEQLMAGDNVRVHDGKHWVQARVIKVDKNPRSY
uniref:Integrase catalytic domain-containing protein n=1 Tax=Strigamia maritima TaxID=126957 RepID=T1IU81_STRMM